MRTVPPKEEKEEFREIGRLGFESEFNRGIARRSRLTSAEPEKRPPIEDEAPLGPCLPRSKRGPILGTAIRISADLLAGKENKSGAATRRAVVPRAKTYDPVEKLLP